MGLTLQPCVPPFWARSGHAQTIWGHLLPSRDSLPTGERCEVILPDGDRLIGRRLDGESDVAVHFFHGLSGNTEADYMRRSAAVARSLGHSVYLWNHRGCGEGAGLAGNPYHSGSASDLRAAIELGKGQKPTHRHFAVGFSLSGNALLLLGSWNEGPMEGLITVNAPIALDAAAVRLQQGLNRLYDRRFVAKCRDHIAVMKRSGRLKTEYRFPRRLTLAEFDDLYTAPAGGFRDRHDYYAKCSAKPRLESIQCPAVMLTAADDPFVDVSDYRQARLGRHTQLHIESFGGHMGYLSARPTPLGTRRWLDYAISEALASVINY